MTRPAQRNDGIQGRGAASGAAPGRWDADPGWGNFATAIRRFWPLIVVAGLIGGLAAAQAVSNRDVIYTTRAEIQIKPVPSNDETFIGLDAIRAVGDLTQTTESAAALLDDQDVAALAARRLGGDWTVPAVVEAVTVVPFGQSSVVHVESESTDPDRAVAVADAYAVAAVESQRRAFLSGLRERITFLEQRKRELPDDDYGAQNDAGARLNTLKGVENQGVNPTISLAGTAEPAASTAIPASILVPVGGLAGLVLGTMVAVALAMANRKVASPEEAVALYHLPVLARLPERALASRASGPGSGWSSSPAVQESLRMVAAHVERRGVPRVVMIASASRGDGRTSVAMGLTRALSDLGYSVVAIDCDIDRPGLAAALDAHSEPTGDNWMEPPSSERLTAPTVSGRISVLAPAPGHEDDFLRRLPGLLDQARATSEYVVVDCPPLGEASDALRVAGQADDVILVAHARNTDRAAFESTRDTLEQMGARPIGLVLLGGSGKGRLPSGRRSRKVDAVSEPASAGDLTPMA